MAKPFVKWIGGKRQLISKIKTLMPSQYNKYIEPFVGGGALFFELNNKHSVINDKNLDLIDTYKVIRDEPKLLLKELRMHKKKNTKDYFLEIREWDRSNRYYTRKAYKRAGRFIFLNKTCFNGMFRVNSFGHFNVPYGKYSNPLIADEKNIFEVSRILQKTKIFNSDFLEIARKAKKGDFVYFDPPYVPLTKTQSFVSYTKDGFSLQEQERLKRVIDKLTKKGVYIMLSNSSAKWIYDNYENYTIHTIKANRMINSNGAKRKGCKEVIILNYNKKGEIINGK